MKKNKKEKLAIIAIVAIIAIIMIALIMLAVELSTAKKEAEQRDAVQDAEIEYLKNEVTDLKNQLQSQEDLILDIQNQIKDSEKTESKKKEDVKNTSSNNKREKKNSGAKTPEKLTNSSRKELVNISGSQIDPDKKITKSVSDMPDDGISDMDANSGAQTPELRIFESQAEDSQNVVAPATTSSSGSEMSKDELNYLYKKNTDVIPVTSVKENSSAAEADGKNSSFSVEENDEKNDSAAEVESKAAPKKAAKLSAAEADKSSSEENDEDEKIYVVALDGYEATVGSELQFKVTGRDLKVKGVENYTLKNNILTVSTGSEATVLTVELSNNVNSTTSFDIIVDDIMK